MSNCVLCIKFEEENSVIDEILESTCGHVLCGRCFHRVVLYNIDLIESSQKIHDDLKLKCIICNSGKFIYSLSYIARLIKSYSKKISLEGNSAQQNLVLKEKKFPYETNFEDFEGVFDFKKEEVMKSIDSKTNQMEEQINKTIASLTELKKQLPEYRCRAQENFKIYSGLMKTVFNNHAFDLSDDSEGGLSNEINLLKLRKSYGHLKFTKVISKDYQLLMNNFNQNIEEFTKEFNKLNSVVPVLSEENISDSDDNLEILINSDVIISKSNNNPFEFYTKEKELEDTQYGKQYLVKHNQLNSTFRVIKEFKKSQENDEFQKSQIINEMNILKKLDHPNIEKIYEFFDQPDAYYISTEYCKEGNLNQYLLKMQEIKSETIAYIMYQIFTAVNYFHSMGVMHMDLKPENIFIESIERNNYPRVKIGNFNSGQFFEKRKVYRKVIGSDYYIAPEVLLKNYNTKCDIWSCGVIMYFLLNGTFASEGNSENENGIKSISFDFSTHSLSRMADYVKALLDSLLTKDPSKRISAEEALNQKFFRNFDIRELVNNLKNDIKFDCIDALKNYQPEKTLQRAAIAYLVHNLNQVENIKEIDKLFKIIDVNYDGKISKSELLTGLKIELKTTDDYIREDVNKIFKNIGSDNDDFVGFGEFIRGGINKRKLFTEETLKFAFRYFDKDGSGEITKEKIKDIFFASVNVDHPNLQKQLELIISEADLNKDGKVTFDEFANMMLHLGK
jgi:calcium-dependent protein kinase